MLQAAPLIYKDELTQLFNHRYFHEILALEINKVADNRKPLSLILLDIDYFKHYNETYGHSVGDALLKQLADFLRQKVGKMGIVARYGGEEFAIITPETGPQMALKRAKKLQKAVEAMDFAGGQVQPGGKITLSMGIASLPSQAREKNELILKAEEALLKAKTINKNRIELYYSAFDHLEGILSESEYSLISAIKTLITIVNAKDKYTYAHSERVLKYALSLAELLKLTPRDKKVLGYSAYLHDLGKLEIPREVLVKAGALTKKERLLVEQHSQWAVDIIKPIKALKKAIPFILYHHERFDGKGYPAGLKGEDIPLGARILALVDSYDAMTSDRPYKKGMNRDQAIRELEKCAGSQFDPKLVNVFVNYLKQTY